MNKLKQIYDYFVYLVDCYGEEDIYKDESSKIHSLLFEFTVDLMEKNKLPLIVSKSDYVKCVEPEIYHGYRFYDDGAEILCDTSFKHGYEGSGLYFTTNFKEAEGYTGLYFQNDLKRKKGEEKVTCDKNRVLKARFASDNMIRRSTESKLIEMFYYEAFDRKIKVISPKKLKEVIEFLNSIEDTYMRRHFNQAFSNYTNSLLVYLGYDYICSNFNHYIVLNRSALVIKESEYNRFCENSEKYKGGYVNIQRGE